MIGFLAPRYHVLWEKRLLEQRKVESRDNVRDCDSNNRAEMTGTETDIMQMFTQRAVIIFYDFQNHGGELRQPQEVNSQQVLAFETFF